MAQRQMTLNFDIDTTGINADLTTGNSYVSVSIRLASSPPAPIPSYLSTGKRLLIDPVTAQYKDGTVDFWPVSAAVIDPTSTTQQALVACKADMDAAVAAGKFDL